MYTVAVIGANGYLGNALALKLYSVGLNVISVYNINKSNLPLPFNNISISELLERKPQIDIIYFSVGNFSNSYSELIYLNCILLNEIIQTFVNTKIIFISSTNVYGTNTKVIDENSEFIAISPYGKAKLAGEFVASTAKKFAIIRFTYLYGAGLNNASFLPKIINDAKNKNEIILFGEGKREQDYLHVNDAIELCLKALYYNENDVFLGATGISLSNLNVSLEITSIFNDCKIRFVGKENALSFKFNPQLTFDKLKWQPQVRFADGIKSMLK